jgi:hypothetical protein
MRSPAEYKDSDSEYIRVRIPSPPYIDNNSVDYNLKGIKIFIKNNIIKVIFYLIQI